jgi:hypothetical protein
MTWKATWRHVNQFRYSLDTYEVSKKEVFDHLNRESKITDFILGYDSVNNEIIGEMFTPIRIRARIPDPKILKMGNEIQGFWIPDPTNVNADYIAEVDPAYLTKGSRYRSSDIVEGAPGSLPAFNAPDCVIPPSTIQAIVEGITAVYRPGEHPPSGDTQALLNENERLKQQVKEFSDKNKRLNQQVLELADRNADLEDKNVQLEEDNTEYMREIESLRRRISQTSQPMRNLEMVNQENRQLRDEIAKLRDTIEKGKRPVTVDDVEVNVESAADNIVFSIDQVREIFDEVARKYNPMYNKKQSTKYPLSGRLRNVVIEKANAGSFTMRGYYDNESKKGTNVLYSWPSEAELRTALLAGIRILENK